jgi:hypothetical protein
MIGYSKNKREVDKDYLRFVRSQPCLVWGCPNKSAAHHDPTVGAGGSDYRALPLCAEEHHTTGVHQMGRGLFQKKHNIDFNAERVRLLIMYVKKLKKGVK